jgi:PAS domain-containing protein
MEVEAIMTNASMSILFTKNRVVTRYNRGFAEMFRYEGDAALGLPGMALYPSRADYERWALKPIPSCRSASRSRPRSKCGAPTTHACGRS